MIYDERFRVRNEAIERALRELAVVIDEHAPEGWGWGLFLAPFGAHAPAPHGQGAVFWISNSERDGMVDVVKGWVEDHERRRRDREGA